VNNAVRSDNAALDGPGGSQSQASADRASGTGQLLASITPEILQVIEAAVTAYLGRRPRILSVKLASEAQARSSSWTSQSRDIVHHSHDVIQRGH
jgi:hypothetical protein